MSWGRSRRWFINSERRKISETYCHVPLVPDDKLGAIPYTSVRIRSHAPLYVVPL